jgi:hypothetical protein
MLLAVIPVFDSDDAEDKRAEKKKNERIDFGDDVISLSNYLNNLK